jgi:ribosomal 50S subunit-recycling heat shock protein
MRLDRYLSVARIFKSRSLAAEAISSSMVYIDSLPAKAAKELQAGMIIEVDTPLFYKKIEVIQLPRGNVSKKDVAELYKLIEERRKD